VYGISHPKYRAALYEKFPCLACTTEDSDDDIRSTTTAEVVTSEKPMETKA
jgi:r-opsin